MCSVHKPDVDTHLIKCGTPADSYQIACGSYMAEEKPLGKQTKKSRPSQWERELEKQQD